MASKTVDGRFTLAVAVDAPAHVRDVDDGLGDGHRSDVAVTSGALDARLGVNSVVEVHHALLGQVMNLLPLDRSALLESGEHLLHLWMIRDHAAMARSTGAQRDEARLGTLLRTSVAASTVELGGGVGFVAEGNRLHRALGVAGSRASTGPSRTSDDDGEKQ